MAILDFDGLALGDPAQDLGRIIAGLSRLSSQDRTGLGGGDDLARRFIRRYGADLDELARARVHTEATLLKVACGSVFRPAVRDRVPALVRRLAAG